MSIVDWGVWDLTSEEVIEIEHENCQCFFSPFVRGKRTWANDGYSRSVNQSAISAVIKSRQRRRKDIIPNECIKMLEIKSERNYSNILNALTSKFFLHPCQTIIRIQSLSLARYVTMSSMSPGWIAAAKDGTPFSEDQRESVWVPRACTPFVTKEF